ncbi:formate dehydrogenase subunit alpha [Thiohalorhabdus methylotrophus]|uniref:NADH-quinone oxidoreductase subunit G n=1 Tax=Thiohalorhabdus methylotrophus TaxID=3242694 RepID=A0ABV4TV42_9GAMM
MGVKPIYYTRPETTPPKDGDPVTFTLNGETLVAEPGETILQAAQRYGTEIPYLCYHDNLRADGNCRSCVVEVEGERVLAPSCCRAPKEGMNVHSDSERARKSQRMVLELLLADQGPAEYTKHSELTYWAEKLGVAESRFPAEKSAESDSSNPAISVNLDACIQCTRCVRACREEQENDVIGYAFRGNEAEIVFDLGDPMGESTCVSCGECVQVCPTGALMPQSAVGEDESEKDVESVCPYCGVGCLLTYHVKDDKIQWTDGRDGPSNHNRLCVKGRYGYDYSRSPERLTKPLIRREDAPKEADPQIDPANPYTHFREATWEEALDRAGYDLRNIRDKYGSQALAGFGSAKGSNEEAYLFQKLVRTGFGTNNVDHCTRLCHASSVKAMLEMIGTGGITNQVEDVARAEVIVVIGANPPVNHPVASSFMKNAAQNGKKLILIDPRRTDMAPHADYMLQFQPDTDVALLNSMMAAILEEGLVDEEFIRSHTSGFEALQEHLAAYSPDHMEPITGIPAETIREVSRLYATSEGSMIFWGMGVSQHSHGTDNARALIDLALMTGQIGRPGTGLHPLRGQNNVQGASDAGLIPMVYPDYQPVNDTATQEKFEQFWGSKLDDQLGLTAVEIFNEAHEGNIKGMYIMGENPAMSDPNLRHSRESLVHLENLTVQDLFLTETAFYADVVLPASAFQEKLGTYTNTDRRVQMGRPALSLPGDARQDLDLIQEIARRLGLDWNYSGPREVWEEMRQCMPSIAGMSWERLDREDSITYPCPTEDHPGTPILFLDKTFWTQDGKAHFQTADFTRAKELPDDEYPFVLITGRQLEHWHTGSMTRRTQVLNAIEPMATLSMHPEDLRQMGLQPGDKVRTYSRRGSVDLATRADDGLHRGQVFLPFAYHEAAANLLTTDVLDPDAKIPEFKYCAVQIQPSAEQDLHLTPEEPTVQTG